MDKVWCWFFVYVCSATIACGLDDRTERFVSTLSSNSKANDTYANGLREQAEKAIEKGLYSQASLLIDRARGMVPSSLDYDRLAWQVSSLEVLEAKVVSKLMSTRLSVHRVEAMARGETPLPIMELAHAVLDVKSDRLKDGESRLRSLTKADASTLHGRKARVFLELGKLSIRANDIDDAISRFHETLAEDDAVWNARLQLAQLLSQKGDHKLAVEQCELMIEQNKDGITFFVFGRVLYGAGEFPRAITAFESSLGYANVPQTVFTELGQIYFRQKNYKMAQQSFNKAYASTGALADKFNEGIAYTGAKAYQAGAAVFEQVIQLNPDNPRAHAELIGALMMAKRPEVARRAVLRFESLKGKYSSLESVNAEIKAMVKPTPVLKMKFSAPVEPIGAPSAPITGQ